MMEGSDHPASCTPWLQTGLNIPEDPDTGRLRKRLPHSPGRTNTVHAKLSVRPLPISNRKWNPLVLQFLELNNMIRLRSQR